MIHIYSNNNIVLWQHVGYHTKNLCAQWEIGVFINAQTKSCTWRKVSSVTSNIPVSILGVFFDPYCRNTTIVDALSSTLSEVVYL